MFSRNLFSVLVIHGLVVILSGNKKYLLWIYCSECRLFSASGSKYCLNHWRHNLSSHVCSVMEFQMHPYMGGQVSWKLNQYFNPDSGVSIWKLLSENTVMLFFNYNSKRFYVMLKIWFLRYYMYESCSLDYPLLVVYGGKCKCNMVSKDVELYVL